MCQAHEIIIKSYLFKLLVSIALITSVNQAWAHSFSVVFVAPMSGTQQESGRQALDGFLFATREEDAHAFEESDGHLGGLDSYILKIDNARGTSIMLKQLEGVLAEEKPIFVTGAFSVESASLLRDAVKNSGVVLVDPVDSVMWRSAVASPENLSLISGEKFSPVFQNKYGYAPNLQVFRGYIAARLVATTVRSLAEADLSDRRRVTKALDQVLENSYWRRQKTAPIPGSDGATCRVIPVSKLRFKTAVTVTTH